jgi:hypothetical protein
MGRTVEIASYGIAVADPAQLSETLRLIAGWPGSWFFEGTEPRYSVRALADSRAHRDAIHAKAALALSM